MSISYLITRKKCVNATWIERILMILSILLILGGLIVASIAVHVSPDFVSASSLVLALLAFIKEILDTII